VDYFDLVKTKATGFVSLQYYWRRSSMDRIEVS